MPNATPQSRFSFILETMRKNSAMLRRVANLPGEVDQPVTNDLLLAVAIFLSATAENLEREAVRFEPKPESVDSSLSVTDIEFIRANEYDLLRAMERHGGGFASRLAQAWGYADREYNAVLMREFGPVLYRYRTYLDYEQTGHQ